MYKKIILQIVVCMSYLGLSAQDVSLMNTHECVDFLLVQSSQDVDVALLQAVRLNRADVVQLLLYKFPSNIHDAIALAKTLNHTDVLKVLIKWKKAKGLASNLAGIGALVGLIKGVSLLYNYIAGPIDYQAIERARLEKNRKRVEEGLKPQDITLEEAIDIVDTLPDKKDFFIQDSDWKYVVMTSQFRHHNWIHQFLDPNNSKNLTQTEELNQKYKLKSLKELQEFCELQKWKSPAPLSTVPLVGFYGEVDCLAAQVSKVERYDAEKGYTTFVHGRNWEWNYVNDVWNIICALRDKSEELPDTISMRQRDVDCDISKLYVARKNLVTKGTIGYHLISSTNDKLKDYNNGERSETTFLNYTGMSHLGCWGESSMRYVIQNHSATGGKSGRQVAQELIKRYGLQKYQIHFDGLYYHHKEASNRGEMLTISIANDKVDDIVWPALPGGYKYSDKKLSDVVAECRDKIKDQKIDYVHTYTKKGSYDCPIFCAGALSIPGEGEDVVKIRSHHLADAEKYQKYQNTKKIVFNYLKRENVSVQKRNS